MPRRILTNDEHAVMCKLTTLADHYDLAMSYLKDGPNITDIKPNVVYYVKSRLMQDLTCTLQAMRYDNQKQLVFRIDGPSWHYIGSPGMASRFIFVNDYDLFRRDVMTLKLEYG